MKTFSIIAFFASHSGEWKNLPFAFRRSNSLLGVSACLLWVILIYINSANNFV